MDCEDVEEDVVKGRYQLYRYSPYERMISFTKDIKFAKLARYIPKE
jgi:hypothetical protein